MPFFPYWSSLRRGTKILTLAATTASAASFVVHQARAKIHGKCEFSEHTRKQHPQHFFSGMHPTFVTQDAHSLAKFHQHFGNFSHLLPRSAEELQQRQALMTSVKISPLKDCPINFQSPAHASKTLAFLAVGGPPALITAVGMLEKGKEVVYLNDERRWPIAYGSAWHIEEDADAEAPTTYSPMTFMKHQILRAIAKRESYEHIEKTGMFPWRTLDWVGFAKNPDQWLPAFKVALGFHQKNTRGPIFRQEEIATVMERCKFNDIFFEQLNQRLNGKLLLPEAGAIIVARNPAEVENLLSQKANLEKEGRYLNILTQDDILKRFGFHLQGMCFAEKPHDRVLSPNFKPLLTAHITKQGGKVIDGTLVSVYSDDKKAGGIAHYRTPDGQDHYQPFEQLAMSLGNQKIFDHHHHPLFDVIGATGSSGLALVYTPTHFKLPRAAVFGETNNVTVLSNEPVRVMHEETPMNLNLIRFTAGACITPAYRGKEGGYYDSSISLGLLNTVYQTLGKECKVVPLTVYGCNRVVSKNGQTDWIQPYPGIHVQYGAGGGGLTRAPDLMAKLEGRVKKGH